jgi:hypothetical protein
MVPRSTKWYRANRERANSSARARYRRNREEILARRREEYQRDRDETALRRLRQRLSVYGITPDDYFLMLEEQDGVCALCAQPERHQQAGRIVRLSVDHCHETGAVRGLLCRSCNSGLGVLENALFVAAARAYLSAPRQAEVA